MNQLAAETVHVHGINVGRKGKRGTSHKYDLSSVRRESGFAGGEVFGTCQTLQIRSINSSNPNIREVLGVFMIMEHQLETIGRNVRSTR